MPHTSSPSGRLVRSDSLQEGDGARGSYYVKLREGTASDVGDHEDNMGVQARPCQDLKGKFPLALTSKAAGLLGKC